MKKQLVFSNHCAGWLMTKGYVLQDLGKRDKGENKQLNVYVFNKTNELLRSLNEYKQLFKK